METLLSVVIPVFNQKNFLYFAIESVIQQTYRNWELIIIDDGSSDHPEEVLESFKDPRIRLFRQSNRGLSAARNKGIELSNSDLIAFLDADDTWLPQFLHKLSDYLKHNPNLGVAFCHCNFINQSGDFICMGPRPTASRMINVSDFWLLRSSPHGCGSTFMIRRQVHNTLGGFDESYKTYEDIEYFLRIVRSHKFQISGISEYLVNYRLHSNSLSKNYSSLTSTLTRLIIKEKDKNSILAFFNRYIAQREMLTSGSRLNVIYRLFNSTILSRQAWKLDFSGTLQCNLAGIAYLILPRLVFFKIVRLCRDHA